MQRLDNAVGEAGGTRERVRVLAGVEMEDGRGGRCRPEHPVGRIGSEAPTDAVERNDSARPSQTSHHFVPGNHSQQCVSPAGAIGLGDRERRRDDRPRRVAPRIHQRVVVQQGMDGDAVSEGRGQRVDLGCPAPEGRGTASGHLLRGVERNHHWFEPVAFEGSPDCVEHAHLGLLGDVLRQIGILQRAEELAELSRYGRSHRVEVQKVSLRGLIGRRSQVRQERGNPARASMHLRAHRRPRAGS